MEPRVYIDTSALISFYFNEIYSQQAQKIFSDTDHFYISELTNIEFISAVRKKVRLEETTEGEVKKIQTLFSNHRKLGLYTLVDFNNTHFKSAEWIIRTTKNSLRTLDALHLGLVFSEKMAVFSFDQIVIKTAKEINIELINYSG